MSPTSASSKVVQIIYYVPESHLEATKQALFDVGAGKIGDYDRCAWQTLGTGQFRPLPGSSPAIGQLNTVEQVPEYKVELVCDAALAEAALEALKKAHPYEEPAFFIYPAIEV